MVIASEPNLMEHVMTINTNNDREHNREMTDAELLAICGGSSAIPHVSPSITNIILGGLGAVAGAVSTAANTIVNAL
jgi:hypothetical protein